MVENMAENMDNRMVETKDYMRASMKERQTAEKMVETKGIMKDVTKD